MEQLIRDLRFGMRQLLRHPVFSLVSAAALALGISAVTTQVSVLNAILLKGLPFEEAEEIVHLERQNVTTQAYNSEVPILEFVEWRQRQTAFEGLAAFYEGTANFTVDHQVIRYSGSFISANAFQLLGEDALIGRTLKPSDDSPEAPGVVVLSYPAWNRDFGKDPEIVGKTAILNGRSVTIVGVMPESFGFPLLQDLWAPLFQQKDPSTLSWGEPEVSLEVFGRLRDEVSLDAANAAMNAVALQLESDFPEEQEGFRVISVKPFVDEYLGGETVPLTLVMFLITVLILIIACANVANLLLGRSIRRQKEFAIRSALGASRSRIVSQFLTESILIAVLGSAIASFLVWSDLNSIKSATDELNAPYWLDFSPDLSVFLAAVFVTLASGIASGIIPAVRAARMREGEILKDDNRTSTSLHAGRIGRALAVIQISVAAVILTLVVLFVQSVNNALNLDYAYNPDEVMTARVGLFEEIYPEDTNRAAFIDALLQRLQAHPEIEAAATTNRYRFLDGFSAEYLDPSQGMEIPDPLYARLQRVSPEFFEAVQLPILEGRAFLPEDFTTETPRTAIVNKAFAERHWEGEAVVGKRFQARVGDLPEKAPLPWLEVVGVVPGMLEDGLFSDGQNREGFYVPQTKVLVPVFNTILVRGPGNPTDLIPVLREEVRALDNNLPLYEIGTPRQLNDQALAQFRFFGSIFKDFGLLAVLLAGVGIYGVITLSVNQRVMEFGVRQALGATRSGILKLIFGHAMNQLVVGLLIALLALSPVILSPGLQETLAIFFYEIEPDSILPYILSFGFVTLVALFSATPPAIRAARIQPAQALRYE
jgi:putative ABC transport system permease protein